MANEEHVKRLKRGVADWNAWRKKQEILSPDLIDADLRATNLRGANLISANLSGTNLSGTNLSGANLRGANLISANLSNANLSGANLRGANLSGTNLFDADLIGANLSDADLSGSNLRGANLIDAKLRGTNLRGANLIDANLFDADLSGANLISASLFRTVLADVNLTGVVGLETCKHHGPSLVGHGTLKKSGRLPLPFLRGVGLPDWLIEYLPSVLEQAVQHYSCFISYSSNDQDFANRIHADLQNNGVRCWLARHDLPIGEKMLDGLDAAIRVHDKVLLILSEHSIKSDWVENEVTRAFAEERSREQTVLFPVRVDDAVNDASEAWVAKLRARNIGDFRRWKITTATSGALSASCVI